MGKKPSHSQSSLKISKNSEKKSLNSLISALRPKVYITDSLSFKQLVQELTGNGNPNGPHEELPLPRMEEGPMDSSDGCSTGQLNQEGYRVLLNDTAPECPASDRSVDFAYRDLESWLLDTGDDQFYYSYDLSSAGVSVNNYELSGLLWRGEQC